jgi:sirohydrochlorin cobaltochelatase
MPIFLRFLCISLFLVLVHSGAWSQEHHQKQTQAVVIAAFGTTVPGALPGILNIRDRVQQQYPHTEIRLAFTSNMIRAIWHKRQHDPAYIKNHPAVPQEILAIQGPLATIANLQDEGFVTILVQPTHITLGEEYLDLLSYVQGLATIRTIKEKNLPFKQLVMGRPALGGMGDLHPYPQDIDRVARSLAADIDQAAKTDSALVYMGHGNDYFPSGGAYLQFADTMNRLFPQVRTYVGTAEGFPAFAHVLQQLQRDKVKNILLKPFMTVAGDHANNDMAGSAAESWQSMLTREGFAVTPVLQGLGEIDSFADVFVSHLSDLAQDHAIVLE